MGATEAARIGQIQTTPSPPSPDPFGIENCKQLFSLRFAFTTQKKATHEAEMMYVECVAIFLGCKCKQWWKKLFTVFATDWVRVGGEGGDSHSLKSMWNTAVGIKNCKQLFSLRVAFTTQNKATRAAEMMSVECVAIFWVVDASSGEKSCLQFSIPNGSRAGGEGGVSHSLKRRLNTDTSPQIFRIIFLRTDLTERWK